jgi:hypothetical protein
MERLSDTNYIPQQILKATSGDLTNLNGERCLLLFNSPGSSSNSAGRGFLILE